MNGMHDAQTQVDLVRAEDRLAEMSEALLAVLLVARFDFPHRLEGRCPDETDPEAFDPACGACQRLRRAWALMASEGWAGVGADE